MEREELAALAKGMVPFVRQCIADMLKITTVPPELAEQVADAVRLLHESPPVITEVQRVASHPTRISRIERDEEGNLVPVYSEAQS